jgi:lipopolysaccharide biosynthesis regulator YciM
MIERLISRVRARLGDLYMLDEHYPEAVDTYRTVISDN